jgi:hypothetical protein
MGINLASSRGKEKKKKKDRRKTVCLVKAGWNKHLACNIDWCLYGIPNPALPADCISKLFENLLCFICACNTLKLDMYAFYLQLESYSTESILSPSFMTKQDLSFCLYGSRGDVL